MKKLLTAVAVLACTGVAFAAGGKSVYSGESLAGATIDTLIAQHAAESGQDTAASAASALVLVNGAREGFQMVEANARLADAKSVEVLSKDGTYVVNIITK